MKYLFILILLSSCSKKDRAMKQVDGLDQPIEFSEYRMACEYVGHAIDRCENSEVVCYTSRYQASESVPNCHIKGDERGSQKRN